MEDQEHRAHIRAFTAVYRSSGEGPWSADVPEVAGARGQGRSLEEAREVIREQVRERSGPSVVANGDPDTGNALLTLARAWPPFTAECRAVLGSELHYQAVLYHCLRTHGQVSPGQLGMNVKIWITDVVSGHFRILDERKAEGFRGGFEPVPDLVIFRPQIEGDFRRRNYENTLRQMLAAVEVKASERYRGRLTAGEIVKDIVKLDALRIEARHRGSDVLPVVVVIDTAPESRERMTADARGEIEAAAHERSLCLFYVAPSDTSVVLSETLSAGP